ncbi:MAG: exo-alpha-sialidase, partial [Actinomycetota bacterium]|nr:exo-alpha-sialidase [Actinomycetota bacterium]
MTTELLVGTKKGLFVLRGDAAAGTPFEIAARAFPGDTVEFAIRDPRTGRYFASHTSGFYGPRLMYADDPTGEWTQAQGPAFPEGGDTALERIWVITPGEADGLLYAGVAPAALFSSTDDGESWSLNEALWKEHQAGDWQPGAGGLALHSICPWPGDPQRLAVGVSAAGVWITDDGGQTWRTGYDGIVPEYLPEEAREGTNTLCIHNMHRAPARPERLFMQFHGNVYRSDDEGSSWKELRAGLPSGFGFPLVIDPADPDSAYVIPLVGAEDRVTPDARMRVYETRDAGSTWIEHGDGLPSDEAYLTVLRQAFGSAG